MSQELVAHSEQEYADIALQLLSNDSLRIATTRRVLAADLSPLQDPSGEEAAAYPRVFHRLIDKHPELLGVDKTPEQERACIAAATDASLSRRSGGDSTRDAFTAKEIARARVEAEMVCADAGAVGRVQPRGALINDYGGPRREGPPVNVTAWLATRSTHAG
jgi:hypothetical protein